MEDVGDWPLKPKKLSPFWGEECRSEREDVGKWERGQSLYDTILVIQGIFHITLMKLYNLLLHGTFDQMI